MPGGINSVKIISQQVVNAEDVGNKEPVDDKTKTVQEKISEINNLEKVEPESTGHKAGRIIAGILGGLLLAAGIAAATVAVTASLGVAAGVLGTVAAFAGITGSSIAAGAAGAAGIGLITTSALLSPKHLQDSHVPLEAKETKAVSVQNPVEMPNPNVEFSYKVKGKYGGLINFVDAKTGELRREDYLPRTAALLAIIFLEHVFEEAHISTEKVTKEGVEAIKNALNQCGEEVKSNKEYGYDRLDAFNKKEFRSALSEFMKEALPDLKAEKDRVIINTFIKALSSDDNQAPQEQQNNDIIFA